MSKLEELLSYKADSLYIHIPFCNSICPYCDFSKYLYDDSKALRYIERVKEDLLLVSNKNLKTIYIGGGTPTSLSSSLLEDLLSFIYHNFKIEEEYTIEINPETLDSEKAKILGKYGINRVSLGVQSLNEKVLSYLQRKHDREAIEKSIKLIKEYVTSNISLDFMYGMSFQEKDDILLDIDFALKNDIKHLSFYSLQIEEGTNFKYHQDYLRDEDDLAQEYDQIVKTLEENQIYRYEVSNFSKRGYESKHNLSYWLDKNYYGVGLSSSGYLGNIRYSITKRLDKYLFKEDLIRKENVLDVSDREFEYLMLHLRLRDGFSLEEYQRLFNKDFLEVYKSKIEKHKDAYLIRERFSLNPKYLYLLDIFLIDLLDFKS